MKSEFYVVKHHGAWRIRLDGKHLGEYPSRDAALRAAVVQAQAAGPEAQVFSTGVISQFSHEWRSGDGPFSAPGSIATATRS
jgi:hypothetical protein